jgi:ammonia channel protein AmtB
MLNTSTIYVLVSIIVLFIIGVFLLVTKGRTNQHSKLTILAMSLVILGIIFGDDRLIGYSFIGIGVLLATMDIIKKVGTKKS